ncbi:hypothetical protein DTO013E5_8568 [Penicillium roqueforti]|uniref:uncharacterized protein n=1 Tax=Penicillium roqueforti TaxID=5082 RepID=UPI00190AC292|nr:uncharacterized protein LCP9604111_4771 [Penicillium roqueforti]KAF9249055.1 hypothetical protein LCP9604111_4771 [Penicillium roqueforti]KAI2673402.1 hypothetical protein CBS147355_7701 [Penicillium roqueforti]KAI2673561.1 hypothetical protein LCP963914a_9007 [Penicillium roqueforti]KAI2700134.1 hypothetical protein CBS147372_5751 [Penicillium roqueforti]KAI2713874.1 hypothetical protein CBS147318_7152 [Penicillium roqueforti]
MDVFSIQIKVYTSVYLSILTYTDFAYASSLGRSYISSASNPSPSMSFSFVIKKLFTSAKDNWDQILQLGSTGINRVQLGVPDLSLVHSLLVSELLQDTITLHLTPCALRFLQDTFVVEICTHPGFKTEEIPPAYWHVSQSPRTSFFQSSLFQGS